MGTGWWCGSPAAHLAMTSPPWDGPGRLRRTRAVCQASHASLPQGNSEISFSSSLLHRLCRDPSVCLCWHLSDSSCTIPCPHLQGGQFGGEVCSSSFSPYSRQDPARSVGLLFPLWWGACRELTIHTFTMNQRPQIKEVPMRTPQNHHQSTNRAPPQDRSCWALGSNSETSESGSS